ncbi:hypothetical protein BR93DRAFT_628264 [Coniochaeta sp. PMI_546]|nr:hypothetical protein BR93DRAFT_628264 [Coniochaeta sp. PMI_546]
MCHRRGGPPLIFKRSFLAYLYILQSIFTFCMATVYLPLGSRRTSRQAKMRLAS